MATNGFAHDQAKDTKANAEQAAERERMRIEREAKAEADRRKRAWEAKEKKWSEIKEEFGITPADELKYAPNPRHWLIDGLLPNKGVAVLYGLPKSFKSFVALDLAWAIAGNRSWAGRDGRRFGGGDVFYIALEGQEGMCKRISAYRASFVPDPEREEEPGDLPPLWLMTRPIDFGCANSPDVDRVGDAIFELLDRGSPRLIIIDTLARTLGGHDENGSGMRNFLDNAERLAEACDCLVLVIHHEGNDTGRPRGHTALPAGVVAQWQLRRKGMQCRLTCERAKDGVEGQVFDISLKRVELLCDRDDDPDYRETTLMVEKIEPVVADQGDRRPLWKRAAEILVNKVEGTGTERPDMALDDFRQALERSHVISERSAERSRRQWHDIKKTLVGRGLALIEGDRIWLPSKTPNG